MSALSAQVQKSPVRAATVLVVLILIAWSAWKSIPISQAKFTESAMANNRMVLNQARLYTVPASIIGQYLLGETALRLSPGGVILYDRAQLDGLLHAVYQASDPTAAELEIRATGQGKSTLLLKHRLEPSERNVDALPYMYLFNPAALPPDTELISLSVSSSSPSAVNWQKTGTISRELFPALARFPFDFESIDAFQLPGWDDAGGFIMIHAPARLTFRVPAGRHRLSFTYGYNPSTFTDPKANSDGAEFGVILHTPPKSRELMKRLLEPFARVADRELQSASFELELTEAGLLEFVATAGPNGNISWDWLVMRDVRFEPVSR